MHRIASYPISGIWFEEQHLHGAEIEAVALVDRASKEDRMIRRRS